VPEADGELLVPGVDGTSRDGISACANHLRLSVGQGSPTILNIHLPPALVVLLKEFGFPLVSAKVVLPDFADVAHRLHIAELCRRLVLPPVGVDGFVSVLLDHPEVQGLGPDLDGEVALAVGQVGEMDHTYW